MAAMRAAFSDITNAQPSAGASAPAAQKAPGAAHSGDDAVQNAEDGEAWTYPESMLRLRRERCFALRDFDTMPKRLGYGKFGEVFKVREARSRRVLVVKQVKKSSLLEEGVVRQFQREVETHCRLDHPNILRCFAYFHDQDFCYLVLEYANGGTLYERLASMPSRRTTERLAAGYTRQLCSALAYLHKRGVLHRDVKPENLLLFLENNVERLKLADFGWTVAQRRDAQRTTLCGTPEYLPPEVCLPRPEPYGTGFDMYTVGVLLYEMLVGQSPFADQTEEGNTLEAIQARILQGVGAVRFPVHVTPQARGLITALMARSPDARPTAMDVLSHPWVVKHAGATPVEEWDR